MKEIARRLVGNVWRTGVVEENGNGGSQSVTLTTFPISAAQIQTIQSLPIELLAAPGATNVIVPIWAVAIFTPGNVAFTGGNAGESFNLGTGDSGDFWLGNGAVDAIIKGSTESAIVFGAQLGWNFAGDLTDAATAFLDAPLTLYAAGSDYAAGNGTMKVAVAYFVAHFS